MKILTNPLPTPYDALAAEYVLANDAVTRESVFFTWITPPCVVMGKYQNAHVEVNLDYIRKNNIQLVRRYSGGGTIFADEGNLMFSFVEPESPDENGHTISFERFIYPVTEFLNSIGVPAILSGRNDISVDGRKISGNSQYHHKGYVVHHGTMMYDCDVEKMAAATTFDTYKTAAKGIASNRERVINIKDYAKEQCPDMASFKESFDSYLAKRHGAESITLDEDRIAQIRDSLFLGDENIFASSKNYSLSKTIRFDGGSITFSFDIKNDNVNDTEISGNFFTARDGFTESVKTRLNGIPFTYEDITKALADIDKELYPIGLKYDILTDGLTDCLIKRN